MTLLPQFSQWHRRESTKFFFAVLGVTSAAFSGIVFTQTLKDPRYCDPDGSGEARLQGFIPFRSSIVLGETGNDDSLKNDIDC